MIPLEFIISLKFTNALEGSDSFPVSAGGSFLLAPAGDVYLVGIFDDICNVQLGINLKIPISVVFDPSCLTAIAIILCVRKD